MKKINLRYIKSLNPCQNRLNNYIEHYSDFEGTLEQFLRLKKITQADKEWVYFRSVSKKTMRLVVADIAESVLYFFEDKFPNDDRPRKAIEAARDAARAAWAAAGAAGDAWAAAGDARDAARAAGVSQEKINLRIMKKYLKGKN